MLGIELWEAVTTNAERGRCWRVSNNYPSAYFTGSRKGKSRKQHLADAAFGKGSKEYLLLNQVQDVTTG